MLVPAVLLSLLIAVPISPPSAPNAVRAVPDEPGAVVLPDAAILQTVVADLDADGRRELVRLVRGDDDAVLAEVWVERGTEWALLGDPVEVVAPARVGPRLDERYVATPVRLLVRRVAGAERVTVASQPHLEEIDVGDPCCLLLHDLVIEPDGAGRVDVAGRNDFADSVLVIDLDGDGTDELLSTQSLPPAGDISYPMLGRVHRWDGEAFRRPTVTRLDIGSGDAPFLLGDSDGLLGQEAAIISTLGPPGLFRIRMVAGDGLAVDAAGIVAEGAMAVPLGDGRGVAIRGAGAGDLVTASWPPAEPVGEPVGRSPVVGATLVGTLSIAGTQHLAVQRPAIATLDLLRLPALERATSIPRSPAAARLSDGPPAPYTGLLGEEGASPPSIVNAGRLITPAVVAGDSPPAIATMAGAAPIGRVGDGSQLALHHGPVGPPPPGPAGGPLVVPVVQPLAWTSIVSFDLVEAPEEDAGALEVEARGALVLSEGGLAVGPGGFTADVVAPAGSRVLVADGATLARVALVLPDSGRLSVPVGAAAGIGEPASRTLRLVVLTPSGHAYEAAWAVVRRDGPPAVEVAATTGLGSSAVAITGSTVAGASVRVDGRSVAVDPDGRFAARVHLPPWPTEVVVEVDDGLGNLARAEVIGVGLFDYRGLPWVPIVVALLAAVGIVLVLRVPRTVPASRASDDDAGLEELEPD